ncbi:SLC5A3 [Cordylochernes scorpioides]|uniref:SLC5A3 n=1 Tax=Cordylochernes scorpioides TaxID=51811 RepID=A0ABY6JWJ0_9ARAC|nr:SLC5A3 [Cordylochernes scorpioides]
MCRSNRGTVSGYFLAGRFMFWFPVGASLFASNIGSEHFIGLAGSGAAAGIGVGSFEINALIILQITGWVFLPVFIASRVCTLPEFMFKRFGGQRIRTYLAVLSLILYIFTKISVNLYSGALFIQQAIKWNLYVSVVILLAMTSICTVTGGLAAVIYTDTLQFFVMIIGAGIVAVKALMEMGTYSEFQQRYMEAVPSKLIPNSTCGLPDKSSWQLLRSWDDPNLPWLGFILGQTPASIWYWCADQMMVQRLLASKSLSHAQGGTLMAGYMKVLPLFFIVMPGMVSRVLFPDEVACVVPEECYKYCQSEVSCSNTAYAKLVMELMPSGLRGLMIAVMLAALMSDLSSIFNSSSTLFTMDIWPQIRKKPNVRELLLVGRVFVIVMVVISFLWIPVIQQLQGGQLYTYIQSVAAYLAPPIAAVYILAILWTRTNEKGAFWGLMLGGLVGLSRMILDYTFPEPPCGMPETRPLILRKVHYMYFAAILFWITTLVTVVTSLMTDPPDPKSLIRTTYWTRFNQSDREDDKENLELKPPQKPLVEYQGDYTEELLEKKLPCSTGEEELPRRQSSSNFILQQVRVFYRWFCGYDQAPTTESQEAEFYSHLKSVMSLKQSRCEKVTLHIFLVTVLALAVAIFVFFSLPVHLTPSNTTTTLP